MQGSVKWFSNKKGYGFITPAEGSSVTEDVFVHQSSIFCEGYRTLVSAFLTDVLNEPEYMIYAYHMQLNDVCGCYITHLTLILCKFSMCIYLSLGRMMGGR